MKKLLAVLLSAILLICLLCPCASAVQPRWSYVTDISGTLDISVFGTASITASGSAGAREVTNCTVIASLQQKKNGNWTELKSWTDSSNGRSASLSTQKWAVAHGYEYQLVITLEAYNDTKLLESGSFTISYGMYH